MEVKITIKPMGRNGLWELRDEINSFVKQNFELLYEGAVRLECNIPADYYAPRRVQINQTRLHEGIGLKYSDGHKYSDDAPPTEEQLRNTVSALQQLLDAAAKDVPAPFELVIINRQE